VVNPRCSVRVACSPARRLRYPISAVIIAAIGIDASIACQCASIRPGISTRPPPSISTRCSLRPASMDRVEIDSTVEPRTRTFEPFDNTGDRPSKTRTLRNNVVLCSLDDID
jgi:hypothetical protein